VERRRRGTSRGRLRPRRRPLREAEAPNVTSAAVALQEAPQGECPFFAFLPPSLLIKKFSRLLSDSLTIYVCEDVHLSLFLASFGGANFLGELVPRAIGLAKSTTLFLFFRVERCVKGLKERFFLRSFWVVYHLAPTN